jgi:KGK domain
MERKIELADDDVVSIESLNLSLTGAALSKMLQIKQKVIHLIQSPLTVWIQQDTVCEVLRVQGGGWVKGKIRTRVVMEFIPDEIESPLDDLRQQLVDKEFG